MKLTLLLPTVATILAFAFLGQVTNAGEVTDKAQVIALERTQKLAKEKLGIELKVFGPHWSGTNEDTSRALEGIPEIKMWFYGPTDSGKFIFPRFLTLENPTWQQAMTTKFPEQFATWSVRYCSQPGDPYAVVVLPGLIGTSSI